MALILAKMPKKTHQIQFPIEFLNLKISGILFTFFNLFKRNPNKGFREFQVHFVHYLSIDHSD